MKGRQPVDDDEADNHIGGNEIIQNTPLPNAFVVHRRNQLDGSTWSATRLILPSQQSNTNYKEDGKEDNTESSTATTTITTTLEIVHSLVLGEDNDRFFFNPDYTIAASTGLTKVWDGTWTILRCLLSEESSSSSLSPSSSSFPIIENNKDEKKKNQQLAIKLLAEACLPSPSSPSTNSKKRDDSADVNRPIIVEMGSGSGLVGLVAAYLGAHVLITDVPTVVENSLEPNIERNTAEAVVSSDSPWPEARSIGRGSVACASYDWRKLSPEENEVPYLYPPNVILAVECLWLKDLLQPFVDASLRLLRLGGANDDGGSSSNSSNNNITSTTPVMFMCSRERSKQNSQIFCSPKMAVQAFREAGCSVTLVMEDPAPPLVENNNISNINEEKASTEAAEQEEVGPVQLYCIRPP